MVLAEAMARGLPIVCTTGGAAAKTVPDAAAIKVAPGDVARSAPSRRPRACDDAALRRRIGEASWAAGQKLPRWEDTARTIAGVIGSVATMSGFDAKWLDLREPADHRSRNEELSRCWPGA